MHTGNLVPKDGLVAKTTFFTAVTPEEEDMLAMDKQLLLDTEVNPLFDFFQRKRWRTECVNVFFCVSPVQAELREIAPLLQEKVQRVLLPCQSNSTCPV